MVGDHEVMSEPWTDRRKRLEDIFPAGVTDSRVQLVPTFEDASRLWRVWVVEWGGEGIVLKDRRSPYRSGTRCQSWWKAKHKLTLPVQVLKCAPELSPWGDWGQAAMMAFAYRDPRGAGSPRPVGGRVDAATRAGRDSVLGRAAERAATASRSGPLGGLPPRSGAAFAG